MITKEENGNDKITNIYQHVTDKIIASLEKETAPWIKPWDNSGACFEIHRNAFTELSYRGINILLLNLVAFDKGYTDPRWVTFNDVQKLGGSIKKGEHHTKIIFWKFLDETGAKNDHMDQTEDKKHARVIPLVRVHRVFNVQQCINLKLKELPKINGGEIKGSIIDTAENILTLPVVRYGGTRAAYVRSNDCILMPPRESFETIEHFYATGFHETVHWTGCESRLNRTFGSRFGDQQYAFEELVAEIGAAFLGGHVGLPFNKMRHPEYIKFWIQTLKDDNKAIFSACRFAQSASDFILEKTKPQEFPAAGNVAAVQ